jgi:hypothetical protein
MIGVLVGRDYAANQIMAHHVAMTEDDMPDAIEPGE